MKDKKHQFGYTIVEVMIVLAVSGMMFVIAANFINGKQAKTSFTQGVNSLASQIQDVIDDVVDGKYSDVALTCNDSSSSVSINPTANPQGKNAPCVFRGKLMHFYGSPNDRNKYEVIPLVDLRAPPSGTATDLSRINSHPTLVQKELVPQRLNVVSGIVTPSAGSDVNAYNIGFIQSSGTRNVSGIGYKSGTQSISLVYVPVSINMSTTNPAIAGSLNGTVSPARSFVICVSDGSRYAIISVGGNANGLLTVSTKMKGESSC